MFILLQKKVRSRIHLFKKKDALLNYIKDTLSHHYKTQWFSFFGSKGKFRMEIREAFSLKQERFLLYVHHDLFNLPVLNFLLSPFLLTFGIFGTNPLSTITSTSLDFTDFSLPTMGHDK
jgi:hypothetical protein